jgi:hypothetical protein
MNKKILIGIAAFAVLMLTLAGVLVAVPVQAQNKGKGLKIEWSQPRIEAQVNKGEVVQYTVTFTPTVDITNAQFRLSASLRNTVTIDPPTFASLTTGTPYQVTLTFTAPADHARKKYHGVAALVDDTRLYAKPLKLRFGVNK